MKEPDNNIFEAYFYGFLSKEDSAVFAESLDNDKALKTDYKAYVQIMDGIMNLEDENNTDNNLDYNVTEHKKVFQYLNQDLPKEESEEIEIKMKRDPNYANFIEEQDGILSILDTETPDDITEYVRNGKPNISMASLGEHSITPSKKKVKIIPLIPSKYRRNLSITATFLLLVMMAWWLEKQSKTTDNWVSNYVIKTEINQEYINDLLDNKQIGFGQVPEKKSLKKALDAMQNTSPIEAETAIRQLGNSEANPLVSKWILANALISQQPTNLAKIDEAISLLEPLDEQDYIDSRIRWSLTIAYLLKTETVSKGVSRLTDIKNGKLIPSHQSLAEQLLKEQAWK